MEIMHFKKKGGTSGEKGWLITGAEGLFQIAKMQS